MIQPLVNIKNPTLQKMELMCTLCTDGKIGDQLTRGEVEIYSVDSTITTSACRDSYGSVS